MPGLLNLRICISDRLFYINVQSQQILNHAESSSSPYPAQCEQSVLPVGQGWSGSLQTLCLLQLKDVRQSNTTQDLIIAAQ